MARYGKPAAAIVVMGVIIAVLFTLCTPRATSRSSAISESAITSPVRVLALDFNPDIPDSGGRRMNAAFGWNDPRTLADEFAADVREADGRCFFG